MLARRNERLQQDINTHKEQRTFYLTERENMMRQRDQLAKGYDEIRKYNSELQKSRDEAVNKQLEVSTLLGEIDFFFYYTHSCQNLYSFLFCLISDRHKQTESDTETQLLLMVKTSTEKGKNS